MDNRKMILVMFGLFLVVFVAYRVLSVAPDMNTRHRLHWIVYGYDRVWYHNRVYIMPNPTTLSNMEKEYMDGRNT